MKRLTSTINHISLIKKVLAPAVILGFAAASLNAQTIVLHSRDNNDGSTLMSYYSELGVWANSSATSAVGGNDFGSRYGSTYTSIVGYKGAVFSFDLPTAGTWQVDVTWGPGGNRNSQNIFHEVTYKDGATFDTLVDQSATTDEWITLGQFDFDAGTGVGQLLLDNSQANVSGSMYADSVRLTLVPEPSTIALGLLGGLGMLLMARRRSA